MAVGHNPFQILRQLSRCPEQLAAFEGSLTALCTDQLRSLENRSFEYRYSQVRPTEIRPNLKLSSRAEARARARLPRRSGALREVSSGSRPG